VLPQGTARSRTGYLGVAMRALAIDHGGDQIRPDFRAVLG
jgi:hypothetical protein